MDCLSRMLFTHHGSADEGHLLTTYLLTYLPTTYPPSSFLMMLSWLSLPNFKFQIMVFPCHPIMAIAHVIQSVSKLIQPTKRLLVQATVKTCFQSSSGDTEDLCLQAPTCHIQTLGMFVMYPASSKNFTITKLAKTRMSRDRKTNRRLCLDRIE